MFHKVLIASDGSEDAMHAAHLGGKIAQAAHSKVIVVNSFNLGAAIAFLAPDAMACSEIIIESGEAAQKDVLARTAAFLTQEGLDALACQTRAEVGHPVEMLLRVAEEEKIDLIVLGSHGESEFQRFLVGSVADGVAHHAPCPVLVGRGKTGEIHRVLVAIDGSERSYKALHAACEIAGPLHAEMDVLNILDPAKPFPEIDPSETDASGYALFVRKAVTERADVTLKESGIEYRICQEKGHPVEEILAFAASNAIDLIVIGSHGSGTFHRLILGSVSYAILHHAMCPVLIVREKRNL